MTYWQLITAALCALAVAAPGAAALYLFLRARAGLRFVDKTYAASELAVDGEDYATRRLGCRTLMEAAEQFSRSRNPHVNNRAAAHFLLGRAELASMVAFECGDVPEEESIEYFERVRTLAGFPARKAPAAGLPKLSAARALAAEAAR